MKRKHVFCAFIRISSAWRDGVYNPRPSNDPIPRLPRVKHGQARALPDLEEWYIPKGHTSKPLAHFRTSSQRL